MSYLVYMQQRRALMNISMEKLVICNKQYANKSICQFGRLDCFFAHNNVTNNILPLV